ncbi:PGPGW domain-containing protein [Egicoccus halophilus]|uniref:TIGR02611 family protein n=1 Tax=Egicoccus halophilus TaxID=1670830 RepID=A0A8J3EYW0_9ACTN|nr:PGPGW domain-containing protein [Egicoccus halophilus]GGI08653.1 hypothetical protein GCM10011354_30170 [Egicoccus halophilus]
MGDEARERADRKVDEARDVYDRHGRVFHVMWIAVGAVVVLGGLAMIVFPGPSTVVVPLGMAMLAVVFGWARRALLEGVDVGDDVLQRYRRAPTSVKVLTWAVSASVAGALIAWTLL